MQPRRRKARISPKADGGRRITMGQRSSPSTPISREASLVTILAGLLVLAGAIAAGQRARIYDSTVLKVLGATRARIAGIYALEYGLLGVITGTLALAAGTLAAWLVARQVFEVPFVFDLGAAVFTVVGGAAATLLFGLAAAWTALSSRPAQHLRNP